MFCLSLVNPIYTPLPFSSDVSGLTISNTTPQSEVCGDRQDNNLNGLVDENCSVNSSSVGIPAANFNKSKSLRIAIVGDVDSNQGLTTQLEIANHYNVQLMIIPGDLEYTNGNEVLSMPGHCSDLLFPTELSILDWSQRHLLLQF